MSERYTIDTIAGFLCVRSESQHFDRPIVTAIFWPISVYRAHHADYVGQVVTPGNDCTYVSGDFRIFALAQHCKTRSIAIVDFELERPRGKHVEYSSGQWIKTTTTKRRVISPSWKFDERVKDDATTFHSYIAELRRLFAES